VWTPSLVVAHDLVLDLLPAHEAALDHNLLDGARAQARLDALPVRVLGLDDAAARAAQGERRPDDGGQPDEPQGQLGRAVARVVVGALDNRGRGVGLAEPVEQVAERLAVLGHPDGLERGAQEADVVALEHAGLGQRHGEVERRLAAQPREQALGLLAGDHRLDCRHRERLEVHGVRDRRVGHDGRRVGVDEDRADALGTQRATGLGARVVELGRLPDDHRPGAQDQHRGRLGPVSAHGRDRQGGGHALRRPAERRPRTGRTPRARRAAPAHPRGGTGRSRWACRDAAAPRPTGR